MQRGMKAVVVLAAVAFGLPLTGHAEYYSYTKENGTTGYADELRQVPERYRDSAKRHADQPLAEYPRLTASAPAPVRAAPRCTVPCDETSEVSGETRAQRGRTVSDEISGGREGRVLLIEPAPEVIVPVVEDDQEPVHVDRHVPRWADGRSRYFTIVRRGDKPLAYIDER